MKKIILSGFTVLTLLLTSCLKDPITLDLSGTGWNLPSFNSSTLDISALGYIKLPLNRYYIYKDQSSGITDSVVVTQSTDSLVFQSSTPGLPFAYFFEIYKLTLTSFTSSANQVWYTGTATSEFPTGTVTPPTPLSIIDSTFSLSGGPGSLPAFWYPFNSSGADQYSYIPSLVIEGTTYTGVHIFKTTNGLQPTNPNYAATEFCWVKGIGIIKKEIRTFNTVKISLLVRFG